MHIKRLCISIVQRLLISILSLYKTTGKEDLIPHRHPVFAFLLCVCCGKQKMKTRVLRARQL